ncbi:sugar transferase [Nodosilinea sp. P-1105]|uniref:sugar transferase n=1 Tax=Nodosilinea sp. P-1105 TaxID=2546229 RepID=UPI00146F6E5B|nr:sugar transferase [Nodosilinea sp. P-1105]NMF83029.1 sugar transferase [Nodosilinea sp. P-1105]
MSSLDLLAKVEQKQLLDLRQSKSPSSFRKGTRFVWFRSISLITTDALALSLAWLGASYTSVLADPSYELATRFSMIPPVLGIGYGILAAGNFYYSGSARKDYVGLIKATTLVAMVMLLLLWSFQIAIPAGLWAHSLLFWLLAMVLVTLGRFVVDRVTNQLRQVGFGLYPVVLIADKPKQATAAATVKQESHYKIVEVMEAEALDKDQRQATLERLSQLGAIEVLVDWQAINHRLFICGLFQSAGFTLRILPSEELPPPGTLYYTSIGNKLCLSCTPFVLSGLEFWTKRVVDVLAASTAVVLASPLYLLIALLIYIDSPGPIFYKQTRIGLKNKPFQVWKFRTMVPNADKLQKQLEAQNETKDGVLFKIKDDPRITRVGKVLRAYSLDELPQLFNVALGEMSLVGPRPLPLRDVEKFSRHHHIRQEVLPGITGLWQISGRSDIIDFEEAYQLDLTYITRWSIWLDLQILFKTVGVVVQKSGAY